jgi:hypothetical protein
MILLEPAPLPLGLFCPCVRAGEEEEEEEEKEEAGGGERRCRLTTRPCTAASHAARILFFRARRIGLLLQAQPSWAPLHALITSLFILPLLASTACGAAAAREAHRREQRRSLAFSQRSSTLALLAIALQRRRMRLATVQRTKAEKLSALNATTETANLRAWLLTAKPEWRCWSQLDAGSEGARHGSTGSPDAASRLQAVTARLKPLTWTKR